MRPGEAPGPSQGSMPQTIWDGPRETFELRLALDDLLEEARGGSNRRVPSSVPAPGTTSARGLLYELIFMLDPGPRRKKVRANVDITWSTDEESCTSRPLLVNLMKLHEMVTGEFERRAACRSRIKFCSC